MNNERTIVFQDGIGPYLYKNAPDKTLVPSLMEALRRMILTQQSGVYGSQAHLVPNKNPGEILSAVLERPTEAVILPVRTMLTEITMGKEWADALGVSVAYGSGWPRQQAQTSVMCMIDALSGPKSLTDYLTWPEAEINSSVFGRGNSPTIDSDEHFFMQLYDCMWNVLRFDKGEPGCGVDGMMQSFRSSFFNPIYHALSGDAKNFRKTLPLLLALPSFVFMTETKSDPDVWFCLDFASEDGPLYSGVRPTIAK